MRHKTTSKIPSLLGGLFLTALLATACTSKPQPPNTTTPPTADSTGGYVQQVEAKGFVIKGAVAADWKPYRRVRFDDQGREIERDELAELGAPRYTTSYDEKGRPVKVQRKGQDRLGDIDYTTVWSPDGRQSTEEEYIHREEKLITRTVKRYDSAGKVLERSVINLQFQEHGVDTQRTSYRYDAEGHLVHEAETFQGKTIPSVNYVYDKAGHLVKIERYDAEGNVSRTEVMEVDGAGRKLVLRVQEQGQPALRLEQRFSWTEAGLLAEEIRYGGDCSPAGEQHGKCIIQETTRYTYDAQGRPLTQDLYRLGESEPVQQLRYRYEPFKQ